MRRASGRLSLLFVLIGAHLAQAQATSSPQTPLASSSVPAAVPAAPATLPARPTTDPLLRDDNLLLFDVSLDRISLTDSLAAYGSPDGILIPLGELTRLLDVDLTVSPPERRITGNVGEARRPILIDLPSGTMRLGGAMSSIAPADFVVGPTDIYIRPSMLERLLPIKVTIDQAGLRILLKASEPLPIQSRLDRLARLRDLRPDLARHDDVLRVAVPHRLASPPSLDISLSSALSDRRPKLPFRYDIRAGADLLYSGFQGYLGSDDKARPTNARATFERRDPRGMFGPLGITRASAGDVFTPSMPIGARSVAGRGMSFTTAPLEQASVFERIDLRGELPAGYDIELYVNDVLRGAQHTPNAGRYEFLAVPLVRGVNVLRLVSYSPRGERTEEVRVISVGGGQLPKGKVVVDFGVTEQDHNVIRLPGQLKDFAQPGEGRLRLITNIAYGLTTGLTVTGGVASFSPNGRGNRELGTLGLRTSIFGLAAQMDGAADSRGGKALAFGFAGQPFGVMTIVRHAEYRRGFVDETTPRAGDGRSLERSSEIAFDWSVKPFGHISIPLSALFERDAFANGDKDLLGTVRASTSIGPVLISAGIDYDRVSTLRAAPDNRLGGNVAASTYSAFKWQLRTSLDYDVLPKPVLRLMSFTADRSVSANVGVRLGLAHSFLDDRASTANASAIFRLPFGTLSVDSAYGVPDHAWRVGVAFAFSLGYDPLSRRYAARRIGAGAGGNLAVQAFVDRNGDGRYEQGETPVAGVSIYGGESTAKTDDQGRAFVTGLGYGPVARVQANIDGVDLDNVAAPPATIEFVPRAGVAAVAMYPLKPQGDAMIRLLFKQADGRLVGLSSVRLRLTASGGTVREGSTEYDGSVSFDHLLADTYRVEIDPAQASRLKMRLGAPLVIVVPADGGVLPEFKAVVEFDRP